MLLLRVIRAQFALQVPQRQVVEREASLTGPHQVRGQRGVRRDAAQRPAAALQVVHRELGLVQRLRRVGVGQPRRQRGLVVGMQVGGVEVATVAVGGDDRQRGGVGVEGQMCADDGQPEPACPWLCVGQPAGQLAGLERAAAHVEALVDLGIGRRQRLEQPLPQHPELEVVEQPVDLVAIPRLHAQRVGGLRQRHVLDQVGQLAVEHDVRQVGAQRVADLALHRVDLVDKRLQRAVLGDPLRRGLLPHARDAGQVVARVAAQRGEVRILLRGQPVLVEHRLRREPGQLADALARVEHRDVVADQLQRVAVAGDHQDPVALVLGLRRQRGDHVVGLEPGLGQHRDAQRAEHLLGDVDLTAELVGGGRSARLVLGVLLQPERLPGHVERRGDVAGLLVAQQVDQHRGEPVHRVGGQSALGLEVLGGQCVERPERQRIAVQQHQCRLFGRLLGRCACGHGPTLCTGADTQ